MVRMLLRAAQCDASWQRSLEKRIELMRCCFIWWLALVCSQGEHSALQAGLGIEGSLATAVAPGLF